MLYEIVMILSTEKYLYISISVMFLCYWLGCSACVHRSQSPAAICSASSRFTAAWERKLLGTLPNHSIYHTIHHTFTRLEGMETAKCSISFAFRRFEQLIFDWSKNSLVLDRGTVLHCTTKTIDQHEKH